MPQKRILFLLSVLFFLLLGIVAIYRTITALKVQSQREKITQIEAKSTPYKVTENNREKTKYPVDYTIVFVGDSMIETLGNFDDLKVSLANDYPNKTFQLLNYGYGSTNILSVQDRLDKITQHGRDFMPINDIAYDLIILESFGHNPLSDFSVEEGLQKQTAALDKIVQTIKDTNPKAKIVFMTTLSPNKETYAAGTVDLTQEKREVWVNERVAYMKNHSDYSTKHGIPLINVFEKSLNDEGTGDTTYINKSDNIHPSEQGIKLISKEIADFLKTNLNQ